MQNFYDYYDDKQRRRYPSDSPPKTVFKQRAGADHVKGARRLGPHALAAVLASSVCIL